MKDENTDKLLFMQGLTLFETIIVILVILSILWFFLPRIPSRTPLSKRVVCKNNMKYLNLALSMYANDYSGAYPTPENWSDLIKPYLGREADDIIRCPAAKEGKSHYAINPNCEPNSPPETVLVFETKGDWNLSGGPELLSIENHGGSGCNVLFKNGQVEFVRKESIGDLKWSKEEKK